jgi:hypothetical protein
MFEMSASYLILQYCSPDSGWSASWNRVHVKAIKRNAAVTVRVTKRRINVPVACER